jgi:hypothetical protein
MMPHKEGACPCALDLRGIALEQFVQNGRDDLIAPFGDAMI